MINSFIAQAKIRLDDIVQDSCLNCQTKLIDASGKLIKDEENIFTKIYKLPIEPEGCLETSSEVHILCNGCEYAVKEDLIRRYNKFKNINLKFNKVAVKCAFCLKTHDVEFKHLKSIFKNHLCNIL